MKKTLQYLLLLIGAVLISKKSFELLFQYSFIATTLIWVSFFLWVGIIFWHKIYWRINNVKFGYLFFILTNFIFTLLLGFFHSHRQLYFVGLYFISILISFFQLYRYVKFIELKKNNHRC
jgi:hypothetical protein